MSITHTYSTFFMTHYSHVEVSLSWDWIHNISSKHTIYPQNN